MFQKNHEPNVNMNQKIEFFLQEKTNSFFSEDLILFIEDKNDPILNSYLLKNITSINIRLEKKGLRLVYFSAIKENSTLLTSQTLQYIRYRVPVLYSLTDNELTEAIETLLLKISPEEFYKIILDDLDLPYLNGPGLLRIMSRMLGENKYKFSYCHIKYHTSEDLDALFSFYIEQVKLPIVEYPDFERIDDSHLLVQRPRFSRNSYEYDADSNFEWESKKETDDLKQIIDDLKKEGKYGVMFEAVMYMLATIKEEKPEIMNKVRPLLEKKRLLESKVILSPVVIDKSYKIILPEFGDIEVKMHALPKTLYILFLRYTDGIRFKELYEYKSELLEIYNQITKKDEKKEIEKAISDLVDVLKPNLNMQCSRIRASFRKLMDEHIAEHYYITGLNGEPKKIGLPPHLIDIRY